MQKQITMQYPEQIRSDTLKFHQAVKSMLNARKYFAKNGYETVNEEISCDLYTQDLHERAKIVMPDKRTIISSDIRSSDNIDQLLAEIAEHEGAFIRPTLQTHSPYDRELLLKTTMQSGDYQAVFTISDVSREGRFFLAKPFIIKPTKFSSSCTLTLEKEVISNSDIHDIQTINFGLGYAMRGDVKK